jgi:hypothetical protein
VGEQKPFIAFKHGKSSKNWLMDYPNGQIHRPELLKQALSGLPVEFRSGRTLVANQVSQQFKN